jgi:hypothetical protein
VREEDLVQVRIRELVVQGQEVVQQRGATPPVAEDEERGLDHDLVEQGAEVAVLAAAVQGIQDAAGGQDRRAGPVGEVDRETIHAEGIPPVAERHPAEVREEHLEHPDAHRLQPRSRAL